MKNDLLRGGGVHLRIRSFGKVHRFEKISPIWNRFFLRFRVISKE